MMRRRILAALGMAAEEVTLGPFFEAMRELGWIEERTLVYERFYAGDRRDRLPALAAALVARQPEVIYAPPSSAALAAARATKSIPIVFGSLNDPVAAGIAQSLARPGGNVTGMATIGADLGPKRLELLKEMMPSLQRIGILSDGSDANSLREVRDLKLASARFDFTIVVGTLNGPDQVEPAMDALAKGGAEVALLTQTALLFNVRKKVLDLASKAQRPVIAHRSEFADEGALASYGPSLAAQLRRSASFVDRILKGAKAPEIPIERPSIFELIINLKAAKGLGIEIPRAVLLRADRLIE